MKRIQFSYKDTCGLNPNLVSEAAGTLSEYRTALSGIGGKIVYGANESSINLPFDEEMHTNVRTIAKKLTTPKLKYVIHIGIGGSSLGTRAIYDAYVGNLDPFLIQRVPKILFIDTISDEKLVALQNLFRFLESPEEIAIVVVSKSGETTETIVNFEIIHALLKARFGEIGSRIALVTEKNSKLWVAGASEGFMLVSIPAKIGGRFSVLSSAGTLSLLLAHVPIDELRGGASIAREAALSEKLEENDALCSAAIMFLHYQKGIAIHNSFFFDPSFESLGKWYRQLLAESLGKDGKGILPLVSIGSIDLHSVGQLYFSGKFNMLTTFIIESFDQKHPRTRVKTPPFLPELAKNLSGRSPQEINIAIYQGVRVAYEKQGFPFTEVALPNVSLKMIGMYIQTKMIEIMYLGQLMDINVFDQPNVEVYKSETRAILQKESD